MTVTVTMCAVRPSFSSTVEPSGLRRRPLGFLRLLPAIMTVGVTLYFELKTNPSLKDFGSIPSKWVRLFDEHDFLVNAIAFGGLAATVQFGFLGFSREPWPAVMRRAAWLAGAVVVLELTQLLLPRRTCDWHDVAAGWLGIAVASLPWLSFPAVRIGHGE